METEDWRERLSISNYPSVFSPRIPTSQLTAYGSSVFSPSPTFAHSTLPSKRVNSMPERLEQASPDEVLCYDNPYLGRC